MLSAIGNRPDPIAKIFTLPPTPTSIYSIFINWALRVPKISQKLFLTNGKISYIITFLDRVL